MGGAIFIELAKWESKNQEHTFTITVHACVCRWGEYLQSQLPIPTYASWTSER